jgi:hypothetical protein
VIQLTTDKILTIAPPICGEDGSKRATRGERAEIIHRDFVTSRVHGWRTDQRSKSRDASVVNQQRDVAECVGCSRDMVIIANVEFDGVAWHSATLFTLRAAA